MKIGILTGGGDVPGLNACIKGLVTSAVDDGHELVGILRGWKGLMCFNPAAASSFSEHCLILNKRSVATIDRTGGTILHTSRINPAAVQPKDVPHFMRGAAPDEKPTEEQATLDLTSRILKNLTHLEIDLLVVLGGDDTLSYAERLHREGVAVIAVPKTMDNDVYGTDYCIGFSTAVTRSIQYIHQLRTCANSHERIAVIELFGRNSGETCLVSAYLAGVDRAIIAEVPFDLKKLAVLILDDMRDKSDHYAMVAISEGSHMTGDQVLEFGEADAYDHRKLGGIGQVTGAALKQLTGQGIIYQQLAYLMRSGPPDSLDLMVGVNFANIAMDLVRDRETGRMVALRDGNYTHIPLSEIAGGLKRVDVDELYDQEQYRPKMRHALGKPMFLY